MKKIIIIGTYPSNQLNESILAKCVDSLTGKGYDLMLVSHYPVPDYIQRKVNYYIYDKENSLLSYEQTPTWVHGSPNFIVEVHANGHMIAVSKNILNGITLADNLGYEFFYYMESDNIFTPEDANKLNQLEADMIEDEKEMIVFCPPEDPLSYETLIFGGKIGFFLESAGLYTKTDDPYFYNTTLERVLYARLFQHADKLLIINENSQDYFLTSSINTISHNYIIEVIGTNLGDTLVIWMLNHADNPNTIKVTIDDKPPIILGPNGWFYNFIELGNRLTVKIEDGAYTTSKEFEVIAENVKKFQEKGIMKFNKQ